MSELRTIDQQASLTPDKPALVMAHDGSAVTFAELVERSARAAHLLRRLGLRPEHHPARLAYHATQTHTTGL